MKRYTVMKELGGCFKGERYFTLRTDLKSAYEIRDDLMTHKRDEDKLLILEYIDSYIEYEYKITYVREVKSYNVTRDSRKTKTVGGFSSVDDCIENIKEYYKIIRGEMVIENIEIYEVNYDEYANLQCRVDGKRDYYHDRINVDEVAKDRNIVVPHISPKKSWWEKILNKLKSFILFYQKSCEDCFYSIEGRGDDKEIYNCTLEGDKGGSVNIKEGIPDWCYLKRNPELVTIRLTKEPNRITKHKLEHGYLERNYYDKWGRE